MTIHFCSLWDSRYGAQGVALYESLARHSTEPFTLWVLALDLETWQTLRLLELPHLHVTPIESFVHEMNLAAVRANRTHQEWCWTLASQWCEYLLRRLPAVNYVDADTFFFSDPWPIFEEINVRSIAITPHRLIPSKKHLEVNGIYNVGFVHFKDTKAGSECSSQWAAQCRDWCYNRNEPGRFGDQKYLDVWPAKYGADCCVIQNIGVNAGPWSLANWTVTEGPRLDGVQLICYHAHEFDAEKNRLTNYDLRPEDRELIYAPYLEAYRAAKQRIVEIGTLASQ